MQKKRPLVEKLMAHKAKEPVSFHVPGHKGIPDLMDDGTNIFNTIFGYDITELPGMDNLHSAEGVIKEAQHLTAQAYGVRHTFFLVNGSTAGILASLLAVTRPGDTVIVDRQCHSSVINALMLGRLKPVFVVRPVDRHTGIPMSVDIKRIKDAFKENKGVKAVVITSPSYYGICSDIKAIADTAEQSGAFVVVDEAHGAHLKFWEGLPVSAVDCGADLVIQSAHNTLPALTQGAWLHVTGKRIDKERLYRMLGIIQTTSPSYPIMASLDAARHIMSSSGAVSLSKICEQTSETRRRINDLDSGLFCPDREYFKKAGCHDYDETKLIINCLGAGIDGHMLDRQLGRANVYGELYDMANWLGVVTAASKQEHLDRLVRGCRGLKTRRVPERRILPGFDIPDICCGMQPWEVLDKEWVRVELDRAEGRISAGGIVPYPPGVPLICPGERFSAAVIDKINKYKALNINIKGLYSGQVEAVVDTNV